MSFLYFQVSVKTEIENTSSRLSADVGESSATNTEPDSSELIEALRIHNIAQLDLPQPVAQRPEKSSSSTTSSQVTSSDRYVSYVIHEMGDSSQDRLPAVPIEADIPIYRNSNRNNQIRPNVDHNQSITKEDDSTEFDATENLTSYTDDALNQKLFKLKNDEDRSLNTSITDDDVDDEFEHNDLMNPLDKSTDKLAESNSLLNVNEDADTCYDLAITPSSNQSSSSSRQQLDDVYIIPGFPGLWRPSTSKFSSNSPKAYDADDESRKSETKVS